MRLLLTTILLALLLSCCIPGGYAAPQWPNPAAAYVVPVEVAASLAPNSANLALLSLEILPPLPGGARYDVFTLLGAPVPVFRTADQVAFEAGASGGLYLLAAVRESTEQAPSDRTLALPDYAAEVLGDAWDFEEGDTEGIDGSGDKPGFLEFEASEGVLRCHIGGIDPFFLWGVMWGSNPPVQEHIDSSLYHIARMRIRQDVPTARWTLYVTDAKGNYRSSDFTVTGPQWQTFELDLAKAFPDLWDGREMAAFRIDPTNELAQAEVEIDYVQLLRDSAQVWIGALLDRQTLDSFSEAASVTLSAPEQATAGAGLRVQLQARDAVGKPAGGAFVRLGWTGLDQVPLGTDAEGKLEIDLAAPTEAGQTQLIASPATLAGRPTGKSAEASLTILPAAPDHFELTATPDRLGMPFDMTDFSVIASLVDGYGNRIQQSGLELEWQLSSGLALKQAEKVTNADGSAKAELQYSGKPLEWQSATAICSVTGLASEPARKVWIPYRKTNLEVLPTGYLAWRDTGELYFPLGGLYANWPAQGVESEERFKSQLDLFPCSDIPFTQPVPFTPELRQLLSDWFGLLRESGCNSLRLMLRNMDLCGEPDPVQLAAVLEYVELARQFGLTTTVVLFEDYTKPPYVNLAVLERIVLPHFSEAELAAMPDYRKRFLIEKRLVGEKAIGIASDGTSADPKYTDPDARRCQRDYLEQLLPVLAATEGIIRYELENEQVNYDLSWVAEMTALIKSIDPETPVVGDPIFFRHPVPGRWREASGIDCFEYHPYTNGELGFDFGLVQATVAEEARLFGGAFMTGEGFAPFLAWDAAKVGDESLAAVRGLRDQLWFSLLAGACGSYKWPDYFVKPLLEYGKAARALARIDFDGFKPAQPDLWLQLPASEPERKTLHQWTEYCLTTGLAWRLAEPGKVPAGREAVDAEVFEAPEGLLPKLEPGAGYQLKYLADSDFRQTLVYLRNFAGVDDVGPEPGECWLRRLAEAQPALKLHLPAAEYQLWVLDLDSGEETTLNSSGEEQIQLGGRSDHDFVVIIIRESR